MSADPAPNLLREMALDRVSPQVRNRIVACQIMVELMSEPGAVWTVKKLAERLELTEAQVREIQRSDEFSDLHAAHNDRELRRGFGVGIGRMVRILDDPESKDQTAISAFKALCTGYKTLQEFAPRQDQADGVASVRELTAQIRAGDLPVRLLAQTEKNPEQSVDEAGETG